MNPLLDELKSVGPTCLLAPVDKDTIKHTNDDAHHRDLTNMAIRNNGNRIKPGSHIQGVEPVHVVCDHDGSADFLVRKVLTCHNQPF